MKQNRLYLVIGALIAVVVILSIYVFRQETKPSGVEIRLDESGISVEEN